MSQEKEQQPEQQQQEQESQEQQQQAQTKRSKYRNITCAVREEIVERVCKNGENIKDISHELGLNISTCKAIVKVYQEEGRVGKKKKRNKIVNVVETYSFYSMDGGKLSQIAPLKIQDSKMSISTDSNFGESISRRSEDRAKELLGEVIQTKKKVEQALLQQQMIQNMGNQAMYFPYGAGGFF